MDTGKGTGPMINGPASGNKVLRVVLKNGIRSQSRKRIGPALDRKAPLARCPAALSSLRKGPIRLRDCDLIPFLKNIAKPRPPPAWT